MPELPEVETIRRGLVRKITGRLIVDVSFGSRDAIRRIINMPPKKFLRKLKRRKITGLRRRGKFIIFELESHFLVIHLGMTGQLTLRDPRKNDEPFVRHPATGLQRTRQHPPDRHTHVAFFLENGNSLLYRDTRQFGRMFLVRSADYKDFFGKLGLEPFTPQYRLCAFAERLKKRRLPIKALLLDQSFVAGVGNIYADEALFEAGIHPARLACSLLPDEQERLFKALSLVLRRGIRYGGTSFRDYVNAQGETGQNQEDLRVYGREGQPCFRCGGPVTKIMLRQRGTHFCSACQRPHPY
ncbi:MAG: bifunctional DNA-formamidopyrimidine glycosylase/DNA-(apurinic or apyrimidinic site) lyase [Deltaproteobacteria bacterium]|nr:bifunctional DNA-formamidopyrimidine glycosylase/DNA-(apurinic or apyrimidinic site) lyase [Deltaproteobacteria bacterium]